MIHESNRFVRHIASLAFCFTATISKQHDDGVKGGKLSMSGGQITARISGKISANILIKKRRTVRVIDST